jgi:DNA-binding MarR family transcriptional regulator
MATEWMGRYRPLVAALVRHSNITQRISSQRAPVAEGISLSAQEWQVFEYILEHTDDDAYMNLISEKLGIAQSTFSKIVKALCGHGLVDKYQTTRNRKNILLRPSEKGLQVYRDYSADLGRKTFEIFFGALADFSDEQIRAFTGAVELLNDRLSAKDEPAPELLLKRD